MKRTLMLFMMISLLLLGNGWAATIYVDAANQSGIEDGTQTNPFDTVVEGLSAAALGDTVSVAPGIYYGNLTGHEDVTLVSQQGPEVTIIDGLGKGRAVNACFRPYNVNMTIDGFTFANSYSGIYACTYFGSPYYPTVTVRNSVFRDMSLAFRISIASKVKLENVVITNVNDALNVIWSQFPTLNNLTIDNARRGMWAWQYPYPYLNNTSITNVETAFHINYYMRVRGTNNNVWNYNNYVVTSRGPAYMEITNTISADPMFVSAPDDYHLTAGSPLIDAGVDVGLPYTGAAPDIGAFEYDASTLPEMVENLAASFADAPAEIYRDPAEQRRHALYQKLSAVLNMLSTVYKDDSDPEKTRALTGCLNKLQNDILAKTDGNNGGNPANDWIIDPVEKTEFYNHVVELIANVQAEIDDINAGN